MLQVVTRQLASQRDHAFLWAPVFMGFGIVVYFSLKFEPPVAVSVGILSASLVISAAIRCFFERAQILVLGIALIAGGFGLAGVRTHMVAEPVLGFRYYGPIEGRIIEIDKSQSEAVRLTLDRVVLSRMSPTRTPANVRVSLHGDQGFMTPAPGQTVILTGHLSAPSGPVEPGGFDFQRMAWFERLGAVGYTRTPVLLASDRVDGGAGLGVYKTRVAISQGVQSRIEGEAGAFAAAIMTGDRSAMGQDSLNALRASNLAHLLAISGMHMGILAAFVFALVRHGLALWQTVALRFATKKIAAVVALFVAIGYLALSGGNIATQRAFIMVAVMLVAVLCDRRALTLRAVAIAAMIVLTLRPEALFGPGFQMSFAATTALVAVFGGLQHIDMDWVPRWFRPIGGVFLSSLVAGLATAPIAAFHFNQIAQFGLIANLLSVPLMGTLVMPAAVLSGVLAPLNLEWIGLWGMEIGLNWILAVAHFVAGLDGGLRHVPTPDPMVLAVIVLGGLGIIVWRGSLRWIGLLPMVCGFILWPLTERPTLLVAESGSLIGVLMADGRAVSKERGENFAAANWLENDGQPVPQSVAYHRNGLSESGRMVRARIGTTDVINVRGATAMAGLQGCGGADVLITNQEVSSALDCTVFDINRLREVGAVAGYLKDGQLRFVSARDQSGSRIWNTHSARQR